MTSQVELIGMTRDELRLFVAELGERQFRGNQLFSWIHEHAVVDLDEMTNLPKEFRSQLRLSSEMDIPEIVDMVPSTETSSRKFLFKLRDGLKIETVFIPEGKRKTVCLSSQVGCPLECKFCATAKMGLLRNLTAGEIVGQLLAVRRETGERITNIVFMGMGEPMLNYQKVLKSAYIINDDDGMNISTRKITISTVGIAKRIRQFTKEKHPFKLALSLNATDETQRASLMPITKKYSIKDCLEALKEYTDRSRKRVTLEYVLMRGTNDSPADARRLASFMKKLNCKLNVIPYNPIVGEPFKRPTVHQLEKFISNVTGGRTMVTVRWSQGKDINAACGQLYVENVEKTVRNQTVVSA